MKKQMKRFTAFLVMIAVMMAELPGELGHCIYKELYVAGIMVWVLLVIMAIVRFLPDKSICH